MVSELQYRKENQQGKVGSRQKDRWRVQGVHLSTYWFPCMRGCLCGRKRIASTKSIGLISCVRGRWQEREIEDSRRMDEEKEEGARRDSRHGRQADRKGREWQEAQRELVCKKSIEEGE